MYIRYLVPKFLVFLDSIFCNVLLVLACDIRDFELVEMLLPFDRVEDAVIRYLNRKLPGDASGHA